jgi:hypothetical protein
MTMDVKAIIETTLKAEIVKALSAAPEAIEALVKAALEHPVTSYGGKPDSYSRGTMPYLDWLVGEQIRNAARAAVQDVVKANEAAIHEAVRKRMSSDTIVDEFARHLVKLANDDWRVTVQFEAEKKYGD